MKRIISALMCLVLLCAAASSVSAAGDNGVYRYEIDGVEYTVTFEDDSLSSETAEAIAETVVGLRDGSVHTYGLGCTLFGHDWAVKQAYVTQHKARANAPRCIRRTYDVTYCEDCDEIKEQLLVSSKYISCCAED